MLDYNSIIVNNNKEKEDKNKYAYEKAIEAYWKHVDRYHTWMNYYAIFNGALFVGFCTLLTATTTVEFGKSINLENNYHVLCILISIIGTLTSICWYNSILGHEKWETNWMNIIEYYETKIFSSLNKGRIYNMLILKKEIIITDADLYNDMVLDEKAKIENGYSTHALAKCFVRLITIAWIVLIFYKCVINIEKLDCFLFSIISIIVVGTFIMLYMRVDNLHSTLQGKVWKNKDIDEWNRKTH